MQMELRFHFDYREKILTPLLGEMEIKNQSEPI